MNQRNRPERLLFVTSCYNEAGNVQELYRRCREVFTEIQATLAGTEQLQFAMVFADNHSSDSTLSELRAIAAADSCVQVLANRSNYGPEASFANALAQATPGDLIVGLASDLQDPPEIASAFIRELLMNTELDAVLAIKQQSNNHPLLSIFRRAYYLALGYSSRLRPVPNGFHGFGAYRAEVIEQLQRQGLLSPSQLLVYANPGTKRAALWIGPQAMIKLSDQDIHQWLEELEADLHQTHPDRALTLAVMSLAIALNSTESHQR